MSYADPDRQREWKRADYAANRERYCAEKRARYASNPAPFLDANKKSRARHAEKRKAEDSARSKDYYKRNRERVLARTLKNERDRYASDWAYAEARRLRSRVREAFRRAGVRKRSATLELAGCTFGELMDHIEAQFADGMCWENRGEWHVDHIYPLCAANLSDSLEASAVCNWRNLRPAWREDNLRKSGRVSDDAKELFSEIKASLTTPSPTEG